ncbi:MAG TPA: class I SAM-dependent methyltransferase [Streptomyces sp.]|uniref:SAM-dependent methyltransferase n=1 Tax=Streptomyces sp. TaxID=1931 RepID=UPI002D4B8148|nr:class I SAM-dependent methyltransferase [Streptomyces sp.]HZG03647.1 class I SAM-dependent methyltransferase [Streptomyces sp.]
MDTQTSTTVSALLDLSDDGVHAALPELERDGGARTLPSLSAEDGSGALWLPGLECVSAQGPDTLWLHDALLGPYSADIVGYLGLVRATGGPVLDLGSGAGRLAVPFARHGFAVVAVDRDGPSLLRLRQWARRIGPRTDRLVTTVRADLTELRLRGRYQLAVLAGAMITAVPPHARPALLREIASHLGTGGLLALDFPDHAPARLAERPRRAFAFRVPRFDGVTETVVARQVFDLADMSERITYYCRCSTPRGVHLRTLTTHKWLVDPERLARDIREAGMCVAQRCRHRIDSVTEHVLLICRPGA